MTKAEKKNYLTRTAFTLAEGGRRPLLNLGQCRTAFTLAEGGRRPHLNLCQRKTAFTLAEVLITLSVIGIVAALTIPSMIENHNNTAWATAKSVFENKLEVAAKQMNTEEKLAGYSTTKDFVNELKKYIKINKVCDSSEITKCFNKEVIWNEGEDPIDMSKIKKAKNLGQKDWATEVIGVQFANGINAVIAYNPNAKQDPYNNQFGATSNSMAILYDVSGNKNPNTNGKDIKGINVTNLGGTTGCLVPEEEVGFCITQILGPNSGYSPMTKAECEQAVSEGKLGITSCYYNYDYWAGAVKACKGIKNIPNPTQLTALASCLYNKEVSSNGTTSGSFDYSKASQFLAVSPGLNYFYVWSSETSGSNLAKVRKFKDLETYWGFNFARANVDILAVCLGD